MKRIFRRRQEAEVDEEEKLWRPAGSITFLVTELRWEGSLQFGKDHAPEVVASVQDRFTQLVRAAVEAQGGLVSAMVADSLLAAFTSPLPAILAAVDANRATLQEPWPEGQPVRGRYALYTGEAEVEAGFDRYRGDALGYAVRLLSVGRSGQVQMGERTAQEAGDHLPPDLTLIDNGVTGIDRFPAEHVYTVSTPFAPAG